MVSFTPGKFSPVVEVSQRTTGTPAAADTSFAGLEEVSEATLRLSLSAARGNGAFVTDPVSNQRLAKVIGSVLAARNIVEQLLFVGVHTRVTSVLRSFNGPVLEPLVRAFNFYGHFELQDKAYVSRDLERSLVQYLFQLRAYATLDVANGTTPAQRSLDDVDLDYYQLSPDGDISFGKKTSLKQYLVELVQTFSATALVPLDERIPLLQTILTISNEDGLNAFLRQIRFRYPDVELPDRDFDETPSPAHKACLLYTSPSPRDTR